MQDRAAAGRVGSYRWGPTGRALCALALGLWLAPWLPAVPASAEVLLLSPEQTQIRFDVDSTLHRVEGTARLLSGEIRFSPEGGPAQGSLVVDARSLDTGNGMRDENMHEKVLESERFPRIELLPETLEVAAHDGDVWHVVLAGTTRIHGGTWPLTVRATVTVDQGAAHVHGQFVIPYVAWGMHDMSNFLLTVGKEVHVDFDATGRIVSTTSATTPPAPERPGAPG